MLLIAARKKANKREFNWQLKFHHLWASEHCLQTLCYGGVLCLKTENKDLFSSLAIEC